MDDDTWAAAMIRANNGSTEVAPKTRTLSRYNSMPGNEMRNMRDGL
jgi:hypothetical protein